MVVGVMGVCSKWFIRSEEFAMLNAFGSGAKWFNLWVKDFESL